MSAAAAARRRLAPALTLPPRRQTRLDTLDATKNRIKKIENLGALTALADLWLGSNDIATFEDAEGVRELAALTTLYLEHNPLASDFEYRMRLTAMVPSLEQLDATPVRRADAGPAGAGASGAAASGAAGEAAPAATAASDAAME